MKIKSLFASASVAAALITVVSAGTVESVAAARVPAGTGCAADFRSPDHTLRGCIIGSAAISGGFAVTTAKGQADRPSGPPSVVIYSRPEQRVRIAWAMVCSRGGSAASSHRKFMTRTVGSTFAPGDSVAITPIGIHWPWTMADLKPLPMPHPDSCTVAVTGQLQGSGALKLYIVSVKR